MRTVNLTPNEYIELMRFIQQSQAIEISYPKAGGQGVVIRASDEFLTKLGY